ncbi:spore germination protein GerW family protein [Actinorugispora endophytica]|uniref:Sporulation protein YtfJ n=1 Tax=Actinorugispora endophytica TaxID=1605990 RepID=A0A4R6VAQ9_9ACTN|nr:spore germination protein GerW family protein [Actinorugispora endophytica]TDQ53727.1 sporulation protein YtfJ [Actinorugispora endophytica]
MIHARPPAERTTTPGELLDSLAAKLGARASAAAVHGDPIECGGVTIIPIARVGYAFGGRTGTGTGRVGRGEGGGGGGGVSAVPVGYIRVADGQAVFKPIHEPVKSLVVPLAVIAGITAVQIVRTALRR